MRRLSSSRTIRLLRAIWRYRGRIADHGAAYQTELAVTVRSALEERRLGAIGLAGYRLAMRALLWAAIFALVVAVALGLGLWQVRHELAIIALLPLAGAALLGWWRLSWGAPLDWLSEFDDPSRTVSAHDLPARLQALASETRGIANAPARIADELDALAREAQQPPA